MSSMPRRLALLLAAAAVGGTFVAGLFIHGVVGGVLVLATAAILASLTAMLWQHVQPKARPLRVAIIAVIVVIGILKIATA
jgi:hypothetical protein